MRSLSAGLLATVLSEEPPVSEEPLVSVDDELPPHAATKSASTATPDTTLEKRRALMISPNTSNVNAYF